MPNVKIPSSFRHYTDGNSEVEVAGATTGETIGRSYNQQIIATVAF
jgi:hypothetical protein